MMGDEVTILGLFMLGIITCLSPCSVALLSLFLTYVIGVGKSAGKGLMVGCAFTLGLSLVFFIIGCAVSYVGVIARSYRIFYGVAGTFLILFGVNNLGLVKGLSSPVKTSFSITRQLDALKLATFKRILKHHYAIASLILGALLGLAWSPCALPMIFPAIILVMTQTVSPLYGGLLLFTFGLGHGVPIIPMSTLLATAREAISKKSVLAGMWMTKAFGLILIAVGIGMILYLFGVF